MGRKGISVATVRRASLATVALAVGILLVAIAAGSAAGVTTCLRSSGVDCSGRLIVEMDGRISPEKLPRRAMHPVALELQGKFSTNGSAHPSALREMVVELDRDIALDARRLPVCRGGRRDIRRSLAQIAKLCHDAIVGRGRADFEVEFPQQRPIRVASRMIVFNQATKGRAATLVAAAEVAVPAPTIVAMPIEVSRAHSRDFGLSAVMKVPVIAGGSGSLLDFRLRVKRLFGHGRQRKSLVTARCTDSVFKLGFPKILFRNEAHTPGVPSVTVFRGGLAIPCTPTG